MNILPKSREPTREQRLIPGQLPICSAISDRPATISRHIAVSQFSQAKVNQGFRIRLDDSLGRCARVVVVGIPPVYS